MTLHIDFSDRVTEHRFQSQHAAFQNRQIDALGDIPGPWEPDYYTDENYRWRETGTGRFVGEKEIKEFQRRERA